MFAKPRLTRVFFAAIAALLLAGCGRTLQPRTSSKLDREQWLTGAVNDASDAYPVAFWADPCRPPKTHEVAGDTLHTAQWLCHFARGLNETIARHGLYDARFASVGKGVLGGKLESGIFQYPCEPDAVDRLQKEPLRLAQIQFVEGSRVRDRAETATRIRIVVLVGGVRLEYETRSLNATWDVDVFSRLGAMILADPKFWAAVKLL